MCKVTVPAVVECKQPKQHQKPQEKVQSSQILRGFQDPFIEKVKIKKLNNIYAFYC